MKNIILSLLLALGVGLSFTPVLADDLDDECLTFCSGEGFEDGHYLAPEPGAECDDGYEQHSENSICCCG